MLSMKSEEDYNRLSAQVRVQVEERLLKSERAARQLQMEDSLEAESDMIKLYEGHLREAESEMRSLELQDKIRKEEFDCEIERLRKEAESARQEERRRLQRMVEQRQWRIFPKIQPTTICRIKLTSDKNQAKTQ